MSKTQAILLAALPCGTMILFAWAIMICNQFWGIDLVAILRGDKPDPEATKPLYLWLAIGVTAICSYYLFKQTRRAVVLLERGVTVVATVDSISPFTSHGQSPVTYHYEYQGQRYDGSDDFTKESIEEIRVCKSFLVILDPEKPGTHGPNWKKLT